MSHLFSILTFSHSEFCPCVEITHQCLNEGKHTHTHTWTKPVNLIQSTVCMLNAVVIVSKRKNYSSLTIERARPRHRLYCMRFTNKNTKCSTNKRLRKIKSKRKKENILNRIDQFNGWNLLFHVSDAVFKWQFEIIVVNVFECIQIHWMIEPRAI